MPPAAISRSSTNLPKICGNIALAYGSALAALPLLSCAPEPEPGPELVLSLHQLEQCPLGQPRGDVSIELDALGDFVASNRTTEVLAASASGLALRFPAATRAVAALAADPAGSRFWGVGERRGDGIDVLLWPEMAPCELAADESYAAPGQALGLSQSRGIVLAVGNSSTDASVALSGLVFDVATGKQQRIELDLPRAYATVSESGDRLLVAGGEDPTLETGMLDDILTFDPTTRQFQATPTRLFRRRSKLAAVLLPSGETLLVGGSDENRAPIAELEAISPETLRTRVTRLVTLRQGRISPYAFKLSDGRIFVAGGELVNGEPASTVEWLTADASAHALPPPRELSARLNRAFVAMPGGAVLGVGGCEPTEPASVTSACREACCPGQQCQACPPPGGFDAVWISHEGLTYPFLIDVVAPRPMLVAASDGAPFLVGDGRLPRLLRFQPWTQRFEPVAVPSELLPTPESPRPLSLDAGAFVWFLQRDGVGRLLGMRHDVRNRYSRDVVLLADPLNPTHVVPDRLPAAENGVVFDGRLALGAAAIHVADTDYEDFALELVLHSGPPPIVLLAGGELGSPLCPWPVLDGALPERLGVIRSDDRASLLRGDLTASCVVSRGRTSIGLRGGGAAPSVVSQLVIRRAR